MNARDLLMNHLNENARLYWGLKDTDYVEKVADQWMDDNEWPMNLFKVLSSYMPDARRLLDMACGCGNLVFFCLKKGYDAYGIEPEPWKREFVRKRIEEERYDPAWPERFIDGVGEGLPFPDDHFDFVFSWQTLEHVDDPRKCLSEIFRVLRPGGILYLHCPVYTGTFEPHYRLPWLPLLPKPLARMYLRLLGKPTLGLDGINYLTTRKIMSWVESIGFTQGICIIETDLDRVSFRRALARMGIPGSSLLYRFYRSYLYFVGFFRCEPAFNRVFKKVGTSLDTGCSSSGST